MEQAAAKGAGSARAKWLIGGGVLLVCVVAGVVTGVVVSQNNNGGGGGGPNSGTGADGLPAVDTVSPTSAPSEAPSDEPSLVPSEPPSEVPSVAPSNSAVPTMAPSSEPSVPPTSVPTPEILNVPVNPVPANPPRGYFNYDINDQEYGPDAWRRVDTRDHPLKEFSNAGWGAWRGHWDFKQPTQNRCGGRARQQSPKDLTEVAGGNEPGWCDAGHEIRSWCGSYPVFSPEYERQILPHKLSLVMNRRACLEIDTNARCRENEPPLADYPRYSSSLSSHSDLLNWDVKVPGEHTLEGVRYDAEIQMLHTHIDNRRISSIGIPVVAKADGFNLPFQEILNEFQMVYDDDMAACSATQRNLRAGVDAQYFNASTATGLAGHGRRLQGGVFNPYSESMMPGVNFYRYDGSTTEPPCFPLTWWVMIEPMYISFEQLNLVKHLLFTHVDANCDKTSVHNEDQEVTRPIQPLGEDRGIQYCPPGSIKKDEVKGRGDGNKCRKPFTE